MSPIELKTETEMIELNSERILIKPIEPENKIGDFHVPDSDEPKRGEVVAIGKPNPKFESYEVGDIVYYDDYGHTPFKYKGENYVRTTYEYIIGKEPNTEN